MGAQEALNQCHRRSAVDVVVAEYGDWLRGANGAGEALCASLHVLEACRVRQEVTEEGSR